MKKVLITYHMTNGEEDAETCIALPMADEVAEDVLTWGDDSRYIRRGGAVRHGIEIRHGRDVGEAAVGRGKRAGPDRLFIRKSRFTKMYMHINETGK